MMRKVEFAAALVVALFAAFACSPGGDVSRGGEGGGTAAAPRPFSAVKVFEEGS